MYLCSKISEMRESKSISTPSVQRLQLPKYVDERGVLTVAEGCIDIPFDIARIFWISNVPSESHRGGHAHWSCHEAIFAVRGSFEIEIDDGSTVAAFVLTEGGDGVVVPAGAWCDLRAFSTDALCLVMASESYDVTGYCHNKEEWRQAFVSRSKLKNRIE